MIGRAWMDQITSARVARALVFAALPSHTADAIVEIGLRVESLVAEYRRDHPDQVPAKEHSGGLLKMGVKVVQVNDWELAQHLECTVEAMWSMRAQFGGASPLLAYVAVMALRAEPPHWLHDALPVIVLESNAMQDIRAQELREAVDRLQPLADTLARVKDGAAEGGRKGARTRQADAISKVEVIEEAKKLGWPGSTDGVNKRLSSKFGCHTNHIGRILKDAISNM